jgi:hypothetical protein
MQHDRGSTTPRPLAARRSTPADDSASRWTAAGALGCGLLGALLFLPAISSGRLADDFVLLRTVRHVSGVLWAFTHNDLGQSAGSGAFYRPVWVLWNVGVYDLAHGPGFAHVVNLLLFAAVCAEVVLLVARVAGSTAAVIAGVAFAVYPSHGESVAWISGNTDLLAVAFGLAAILVALAARPAPRRDAGVAALTALAMLTKEIAVVLPALTALVLWASPPAPGHRRPRGYWRPVWVMLVTVAVTLIPRTLVVGGIGGYGGQPLTPKRGAGSLASFIAGGLSWPQLPLLAHPVLFLVPLTAAAILAAATFRAWTGGDRPAARLALAGGAWFLVALVPVLNQPLNLNTRNGDRLLLLPSVGLALAFGVLLARARLRTAALIAGALAVLCATSSVQNALDWRAAGVESRRLLADINRLAPRGARLVALSVPTDYRAAHLYPDGLDIALQQTGRPGLTLIACMPVHALSLRPRQVSFAALGHGLWLGRASAAAPFDVPVLGSSAAQTSPGCRFAAAARQPPVTLGTARTALVLPAPTAGNTVPIYFDGLDMRRAASSARAR